MKNKFILLMVLCISLFFSLEVNAATQYRVLFDQNYGYGLECDGPTSYVRDGVCAGNVNAGTNISFPASSSSMYRSGEGLLVGWTKTLDDNNAPECAVSYNGSSYDNSVIPYDSTYQVNSNTDFYACYKSVVNGYRYAQEGASADGQNIPCGSALGITYCNRESDGNEYCYYDMIGQNRASGKVYRNKLTLSDVTNCTSTIAQEEVNAYKYAVTEAIRDVNFECGSKIYVTTCSNGICNFTKVVNSDGSKTSVSGTVNQNYLYDNEQRALDLCPDREESVKECSNQKQKNVKGIHTFSLCYNKDYTDNEVKEMINEKGIVSCGKNYELDKTSTRANGDVSCNSRNCTRNFTVNCVKAGTSNNSIITITPSSSNVGSDGYGVVKIKSSTTDGKIVSYYVSEEYTRPTSKSEWTSVNSGNFEIRMTPGVKYLWVKDSNGNISNSVTISVLDTVNNTTTLKTLELYDANNQITIPNRISYSSESVNKYVKLSNKLKVDDNVIASGFSPFDSEYKLEVDSPTITVYATLTSEDASYVPGYEPRTVNLDYGVNTVLIKIIDKEGKQRTYTILVTRTDNRKSDNTLSDITTSVGEINFNSNVTDYKIEISKNTTSVDVNAKITSDVASFVSGYEPGTVEITGDTTTKLIKVKSQTGSTRTYVLTFVKEGTDEITKESLQLSDLTIPGVYVPFEENVSNYNLSVDYSKDIIDIYAPLKDSDSTIVIRVKKQSDTEYNVSSNMGIGLDVGVNFIEIKIVDKDNDVSFYRLTIIRKEFGLDVSNDTTLKDLKVLGHNIDFNAAKKEYTVKIKTEKTLVITAVPTSNRAEVFIRGNDELTGFSTVRVKVVAENGEYETYSIDIKKDIYNKNIERASIVAGAVIILISSCIIVIKKKNKSRREYFEE